MRDGYMDEARLIEKLRLIEALYGGASTQGERDAAANARQRILERLIRIENEQPPIEYRFTMADMWSRKVFLALLRRYGLKPYRYKGQRYTTVMVRVSPRFVDETLWPEFQELSSTLRVYLGEVTDRVVSKVIHEDSSEAPVVEKQKALPPQREVEADTAANTSDPVDQGQGQASAPTAQASNPTAQASAPTGQGQASNPTAQAKSGTSGQRKKNAAKRNRKKGRRKKKRR